MKICMILFFCILMMTGCGESVKTAEETGILNHIFRQTESPLTDIERCLTDGEAEYAFCAMGRYRKEVQEDATCMMSFFPTDGTETVVADFLGFLSDNGGYIRYVHSFAADDDGNLYVTDNDRTLCVSSGFGEITDLSTRCGDVQELQRGRDGTVYIVDIDYTTGAVLTPLTPAGTDSTGAFYIEDARIDKVYLGQDSTAYYLAEDKIFAYNPGAEPEIVMNIADSGFLYKYIDKMIVSSRERIVFRYEPAFIERIEHRVAVYEKAPDMDLSQVQTITLAARVNDAMLNKQIALFHAEHPEIRIHLADYSKSGENQLVMDLQTGNLVPDLYYGCVTDAQFGQYVHHGGYIDLYALMEEEPVFTKENLFASIRKSYEKDGKLYGIPMTLAYKTVIARKASVGEQRTWTASDLLRISNALSEDSCLFEWVQRDAAAYFLSANALTYYIHQDTGLCSFDTKQFTDLITWIKSLPETAERLAVQYDYNDEEERTAVYREGRIQAKIFKNSSIMGIGESFASFGRENTVMIGYPVYDTETQSGFLMNENNPVLMIVNEEKKESAWEFLKSCTSHLDSNDIPVWKSVYNNLMAERSAFQQYFTASGGHAVYVGDDPSYIMRTDEPGELIRWDSEYCAWIYALLDTAGAPVPVGGMYSQIAAIVTEEVSACLAGEGDASACAARIQARAQICMDEYLG